jgi:hypothetical protein
MPGGAINVHRAEWVSLTHKRDLQALLQVHILGLELVKLR